MFSITFIAFASVSMSCPGAIIDSSSLFGPKSLPLLARLPSSNAPRELSSTWMRIASRNLPLAWFRLCIYSRRVCLLSNFSFFFFSSSWCLLLLTSRFLSHRSEPYQLFPCLLLSMLSRSLCSPSSSSEVGPLPLPTSSFRYVSGEHLSSYSGVSQEEFLLRHYPLLSSLQTSSLEICLQLQIPPKEVIANSL